MKRSIDVDTEGQVAKKPRLLAFTEQLDNPVHSDVTLHLLPAGRTVLCHKVILAAASTFFAGMFASGMKEVKEGHVNLTVDDPDLFMVVLHYIYADGQFKEMPRDMALVHCWHLGDYYGIPRLCDDMEEAMQTSAYSSLADMIHVFEAIHDNVRLGDPKASLTRDIINFLDVHKRIGDATGSFLVNETFLTLPHATLCAILMDDDLGVHTEDEVLAAATAWWVRNKDKCAWHALVEDVIRLGYLTHGTLLAMLLVEEARPLHEKVVKALRARPGLMTDSMEAARKRYSGFRPGSRLYGVGDGPIWDKPIAYLVDGTSDDTEYYFNGNWYGLEPITAVKDEWIVGVKLTRAWWTPLHASDKTGHLGGDARITTQWTNRSRWVHTGVAITTGGQGQKVPKNHIVDATRFKVGLVLSYEEERFYERLHVLRTTTDT